MANCHEQLLAFNEDLNISQTTKTRLASANRTVREHIKKQCAEKGYPFKRFKVQGSKQLGTLIRKHGKESDIDIGVYFYPKPLLEPKSLMKVIHRFFVNGHSTRTRPKHKKKCVRIPYAGGLHVDLPVYYLEGLQGRGKSYLATPEGWIRSDPREFEDWFAQQGGSDQAQLIRIVRYLKAWCHHIAGGRQVPKGVALTTLVSILFKSHKRDDEALLFVLRGMDRMLTKKWSCLMVVTPNDELLRNISIPDREHFLLELRLFVVDAHRATKARKLSDASALWKKHLGRHFQARLKS